MRAGYDDVVLAEVATSSTQLREHTPQIAATRPGRALTAYISGR